MTDPNRHRHGDKNDNLICEACAESERARIRTEVADEHTALGNGTKRTVPLTNGVLVDWHTAGLVLERVLDLLDKEGSEPQCGNPFCENGYDEMNNEPCACSIDEGGSDEHG